MRGVEQAVRVPEPGRMREGPLEPKAVEPDRMLEDSRAVEVLKRKQVVVVVQREQLRNTTRARIRRLRIVINNQLDIPIPYERDSPVLSADSQPDRMQRSTTLPMSSEHRQPSESRSYCAKHTDYANINLVPFTNPDRYLLTQHSGRSLAS